MIVDYEGVERNEPVIDYYDVEVIERVSKLTSEEWKNREVVV